MVQGKRTKPNEIVGDGLQLLAGGRVIRDEEVGVKSEIGIGHDGNVVNTNQATPSLVIHGTKPRNDTSRVYDLNLAISTGWDQHFNVFAIYLCLDDL